MKIGKIMFENKRLSTISEEIDFAKFKQRKMSFDLPKNETVKLISNKPNRLSSKTIKFLSLDTKESENITLSIFGSSLSDHSGRDSIPKIVTVCSKKLLKMGALSHENLFFNLVDKSALIRFKTLINWCKFSPSFFRVSLLYNIIIFPL